MSLFDTDISKLPSKIKNKNLLSAIIELRFDLVVPAEQIIWSLFNDMKDSFSTPAKLPISDIPRNIRLADENLKSLILYTMVDNNNIYRINCGEGIITLEIGSFNYTEWNDFYAEFECIFNKIRDNIHQINRIGVRYINAFNNCDYNNFKINLCVNGKSLENNPLQLTFEYLNSERIVKIRFLNKAQYSINNEKYTDIVILDIDAIYNKEIDINQLAKIIKDSHLIVKDAFFGMCKDSFINDVLQPIGKEDI